MMTIRRVFVLGFLALGFSVVQLSLAVAGEGARLKNAVVVNGEAISGETFFNELNRILRMRFGSSKGIDEATLARIKKEVMETLISRELLYQESKKSGITVSEAELGTQIRELKNSFDTDLEFSDTLERMNLSEPALRALVEHGMAIRKYMERELAVDTTEIAEKDVRAYYDAHSDDFTSPMQMRVSHILFRKESKADDQASARRKLEQIRQRLLKGEDFATLARQLSQCPSGKKGGDLGYFKKGQIAKPLENVIFSLNKGEVSDIVDDKFGSHLFTVTEVNPSSQIPFERAKGKIRELIREELAAKKLSPLLRNLREKAKIELLLQDE